MQTACGLAGDMFTHADAVLHEGCPVTSGTRCILVGFVAVDVSVSTARDLFRWNQRIKSALDNKLDDVTALSRSWQAVQAPPEEDKWLQEVNSSEPTGSAVRVAEAIQAVASGRKRHTSLPIPEALVGARSISKQHCDSCTPGQ